MTNLTKDDVLKLAKLSNIYLSDDELRDITQDLKIIIGYVSQLKELDLSDVKPTDQVTGLTNVMRPDDPYDYKVTTEQLLSNVPVREGNYIKVRRVIDNV